MPPLASNRRLLTSLRCIHLRSICCFLALSLLSVSCSAVYQGGEPRVTAWKVRGEHNTLYLLGSVHVLSRKSYPLKSPLVRAFSDARGVVFEIDLNRFTTRKFQQEFRRTALYPPGQSLLNKVSSGTLELLKEVLPVYGLTLEKVKRLKPWFIAEWLSTRTLEMAGFSEDLGVDIYFFRQARASGKTVLGLETLRDQAQIFNHFDDEQNERYLVETIATLANYPAAIGRLVSAWQNGNVKLLDRILNQDRASDPLTHQALFSERNAKWVPKIEALAHQDQNYLVIVGAGHLVGDDGVVAQLRRAGYSIEQL
jgi:uncharacterized protein YbaP (TraB family)